MPETSLSILATAGVGAEGTYGTAVTPSFYVPFISCAANVKRENSPRLSAGGLMVHCYPVGPKEVSGTIVTHDAATLQSLLTLWLGNTTEFYNGNRLSSFTLTRGNLNDAADRFTGCMMDTFSLAIGVRQPATFSFSWIGQNSSTTSNGSPTVGVEEPFMDWSGTIRLNETQSQTITAFRMSAANHLSKFPGANGTNLINGLFPGVRTVTGSLVSDFDDHLFWTPVVAGTPVSLYLDFTTRPSAAFAHQYELKIKLPNVLYDSANVTVQGDQVVPVSVNWLAGKSDSLGYDVQFTIIQT